MTGALLPSELVYEIIDCLAELHPGSLKAGSLVCHAWLSRIRPYLFRTVALNTSNIIAFGELLRSPNDCSFLPLIRRINAHRLIGDPLDGIYFNAIADDLRTLTHIHTLTYSADNAYRTGFVTAFPQLTTLDLICGFGIGPLHTDAVIDMICLFPALEVLQLRDVFRGVTGEIPDTAKPPQKLRSVILGAGAAGDSTPSRLPDIVGFGAPMALRCPKRYSVTVIRFAILTLLSRLYRFTDPVGISLSCIVDPLSIFNLSLVPNLKTLTIRDLRPRPESERFSVLINRLIAPALERLSCEIDISFHQREDSEFMDAFLSRERFPLLKQVTLRIAHPRECTLALRTFPLLHAAGLLRAEWRGHKSRAIS
ncbi:hypothetical protein R3P38DRAFT_3202429 [Favolaschia claudopus]|uniref:F-box domain-containing protein n=1 Tax=Favolaschia claudopus TaxID=2862362 RepID=A0AAW0AWU0_9AGAR